MNIQIYLSKKNFDAQKAERFFKERRVPCQIVDLKRHRLGMRELSLFARAAGGAYQLVDRADTKTRSHPAAHTTDEEAILGYLLENPALMRAPIVRNGQRATVGLDEQAWLSWLSEG